MNREARKIRILMAKPGLDSHDVGIRQSPERIVETAIQEDVDFIGMSFHSLAHKKLTAAVIDLLKRRDATDKMVLIGGNILKKDIPEFKAMGVMEVFPVETPIDHIVSFIREAAEGRAS